MNTTMDLVNQPKFLVNFESSRWRDHQETRFAGNEYGDGLDQSKKKNPEWNNFLNTWKKETEWNKDSRTLS